MHLDFTEEQDDLRDSIRAVLRRECPPALVRSVIETAAGAAPGGETPTAADAVAALHATMTGLDWPGLAVPEEYGGVGYGFVELGILVEELGYVVAPGPLFPTVTQFVPAVQHACTDEQKKRFLGAVAAGELTGTLAVAEHEGRWDLGIGSTTGEPSALGTTARAEGDAWILNGEKRYVMGATEVDEIIVVAQLGDGAVTRDIGMFAVPAAGVAVEPLDAVDQSRSVGTVRLDGVRVEADRMLGGAHDATAAASAAVEESTVALALEIIGTCQAIFDTNVAYAKEREQFDKPIGSFQAVKHRLADGLIALERARACCYFAAACIAEDDPRRSLAVSVAKAAAGDCQRYVAREGIQLLGGIGYTWEHDMQIFVKRAKSGDALLGTASQHRERIARMVSDRRVDHHGPRWTLDGR